MKVSYNVEFETENVWFVARGYSRLVCIQK